MRAYIELSSINVYLGTQYLNVTNTENIYTSDLTYYGCPDTAAVNGSELCLFLGDNCTTIDCIYTETDCAGQPVSDEIENAVINSCGICVGNGTLISEDTNEFNTGPYGSDCNGTCNGDAIIDDCGVCSGGLSGHVFNSEMDCLCWIYCWCWCFYDF